MKIHKLSVISLLLGSITYANEYVDQSQLAPDKASIKSLIEMEGNQPEHREATTSLALQIVTEQAPPPPQPDADIFKLPNEVLVHVFEYVPTSAGSLLMVCKLFRDTVVLMQEKERIYINAWPQAIQPFDLNSTRAGLRCLMSSLPSLRSKDNSCFFSASWSAHMSGQLKRYKSEIDTWVSAAKEVGLDFVETRATDNRFRPFSFAEVIKAEAIFKSHLFFSSHVHIGKVLLDVCSLAINQDAKKITNDFHNEECLSLFLNHHQSKECTLIKRALTIYKGWRSTQEGSDWLIEADNKTSFGRLLMSKEFVYDRSAYQEDENLLETQLTQLGLDLHAYLVSAEAAYQRLLLSIIH